MATTFSLFMNPDKNVRIQFPVSNLETLAKPRTARKIVP
jgi:hypothetical protein